MMGSTRLVASCRLAAGAIPTSLENEKCTVFVTGSSTRRMKSVLCFGLEVPQGE